jgi:hypothetical protein
MAHNREELLERIDKLPLFEKRDVYVRNTNEDKDYSTTKQMQTAICEEGKTESLAYVFKNYKLVQFHTIFKPILESIPGEVSGYLGHYGGFAFLKVFPEMDALKDDKAQFGLMAINSVDLSASIIVKFVVKHGDRGLNFTIPAKIAGLKKQHTGKVENVVRDYVSMIGKVKDAWYSIVENFPKYKIYLDISKAPEDERALEFGTVIDKLKLGTRMAKKLKKQYEEYTNQGKRYTLWDVFIRVVNETADVKYKSDAHRERRLETLSNTVFEYAMALSI